MSRATCRRARRVVSGAIACLVLLLGFLGPTIAQDVTTGTIAGRVTDPTGKGISGAVVIATSEFGPRTGTTDDQGDFVLPYVKPGAYSVRVEAGGGFNS